MLTPMKEVRIAKIDIHQTITWKCTNEDMFASSFTNSPTPIFPEIVCAKKSGLALKTALSEVMDHSI